MSDGNGHEQPDAELAALLQLLHLPKIGPARARWLLSANSAMEVSAALQRGALPVSDASPPAGVTRALVQLWCNRIGTIDGPSLLDRHREAGHHILTAADSRWPFANDPEPPVAVFARGRIEALDHSLRVAVVGTRRCTSIGRRVAAEFGADLTSAGISVVSGLALGIDGAAHTGALAARLAETGPAPIAVVASGLDRRYPPKHAELWDAMAEVGLLLSEAPLGTAPERWRFPARNRLIAGLADALVVVESHDRGGALLTADEAAERGVPVLAVPGSVTSSAAAGTNSLLLDGCGPVRSAQDVVDLVGLSSARSTARQAPAEQQQLDLDPLASAVLAEVEAGAVSLDTLVAMGPASVGSDCTLTDVLQTIHRLEREGRVMRDGNWVGLPTQAS